MILGLSLAPGHRGITGNCKTDEFDRYLLKSQ